MANKNKGGMSKKLQQAVQHANQENPNTRTRREPNTSKKERED